MIFRALFFTTLTAFGLASSPLMPPAKNKQSPVIQDNFEVISWGIKGEAFAQLSQHPPHWWQWHFKQQDNMNLDKTLNTVSSEKINTNLFNKGPILLHKTKEGIRTETLIAGPHNETLRYSLLIKEKQENKKPDWWPPHFKFYGFTRVGFNETAIGLLRNSINLEKKLPEAGQPWIKISNEFYQGKSGLWWAFINNTNIRIVRMDSEEDTNER